MASLIIQQMYKEILTVADEMGGKLNKRVMFYLDEIGTIPKIDSLEMIYSAIRSRKVSIVGIIQSFAQLNKNYGKEGAEIIVDNRNEYIEFEEIELFEKSMKILFPKSFIDLPENMKKIKYPSEQRPQIIKTSLDTSVNFGFSLLPLPIRNEQT